MQLPEFKALRGFCEPTRSQVIREKELNLRDPVILVSGRFTGYPGIASGDHLNASSRTPTPNYSASTSERDRFVLSLKQPKSNIQAKHKKLER